jgi:hypothetical protein
MAGTWVGSSDYWGRAPSLRGRIAPGAAVVLALATLGLIAMSTPSEAGPWVPNRDSAATAVPLPVRDYCSHGFHRENKQRNK